MWVEKSIEYFFGSLIDKKELIKSIQKVIRIIYYLIKCICLNDDIEYAKINNKYENEWTYFWNGQFSFNGTKVTLHNVAAGKSSWKNT